MRNPPDFVLFFSCIFLHFFSCVSVYLHVQYVVWNLAVPPPNRHLYHPSLYNTPERFWIVQKQKSTQTNACFFVSQPYDMRLEAIPSKKKENHMLVVVLFLSGNFVYFEITIIIYTLKQLFYYFICARM